MALRDAAVRKGLHVSEYGVLDDSTGETHRCATEAEVYALLGLEYIEPELRENRGELEAAANGNAAGPDRARRPPRGPALPHDGLGRDGLDRGDGGGRARRRLSSTSRSPTTRRASGSATTSHPTGCATTSRRSAPTSVDGIELLAGSEVNILPDGSLDYDDEVLGRARLGDRERPLLVPDGRRTMTRRIIGAMENPLVDAIGHLSGRKIERREPYALDAERVIEAAAQDRHDARDQRQPRPPRPQRGQRARGRRRGRADPDQLRRAPGRGLRGRSLRRSRPPGAHG